LGVAGTIANLIATSGSGGLQITNDATPVANTGTFVPIKASAFITVSTIKAKENVAPFTRSGLDIVKNTEIVGYQFKAEERPRVGFIAEWTDELLSGPNHNENDLGTTLGVALKAIQELAEDNVSLRREIGELRARLS
jgi:hypothetical protein